MSFPPTEGRAGIHFRLDTRSALRQAGMTKMQKGIYEKVCIKNYVRRFL